MPSSWNLDSWPEPCDPCLSSPPSLWDRLSGLRHQVNPSASALRLVPLLPALALRPAPLVSANFLRPGPSGSRFLRIRPPAGSLPRSACAARFFSPALWPCLGVPFRCLPACAWNQSPGLPFRTGSCEPVLPVPFRSLFHSRLAPFVSARPSGLPSGSSSGLRPPPTLPAAFAVCRPACACLLTLRLRRGPVGYS